MKRLFSLRKERRAPTSASETWDESETQLWLKSKHLPKNVTRPLKPFSLKLLENWSLDDFGKQGIAEQYAKMIMDDIQQLQAAPGNADDTAFRNKEAGSMAKQSMPLQPGGDGLPSEAGEAAERPQEPGLRQKPQLAALLTEEAAPEDKASPPGVREHAAALAALVGGDNQAGSVAAFLMQSGCAGHGLKAATAASEESAAVFKAVYALCDLAERARINHANCMDLAALGRRVLVILDAHGAGELLLEQQDVLAGLLEHACALLVPYTRQGWLLKLAFEDTLKRDFDEAHNDIVKLLTEAVSVKSSQPLRLLPGAYVDFGKSLRRTLKYLGGGSAAWGLIDASRGNEAAVRTIAELLQVSEKAVEEELRMVPDSSLNLESVYRSLHGAAASGTRLQSNDTKELFDWYRRANDGISSEELKEVLRDMGYLKHMADEEEALRFAGSQMRLADHDEDGLLNQAEFAAYYDSLVSSTAQHSIRATLGLKVEEELHALFVTFANFSRHSEAMDTMDGPCFVKLCRDTGLLKRAGGALSSTDVDLVFMGVKEKGARRITFNQFLACLMRLAARLRQPFDEFVLQITKSGSRPVLHGTKAGYNKFHDDRSTYTGVYSRGGPTSVEPSKDLSSLLDRSPATVRGVKLLSSEAGTPREARPRTPSSAARSTHGAKRDSPLSARTNTAHRRRNSSPLQKKGSAQLPGGPVSMADAQETFEKYANFGRSGVEVSAAQDMSSSQFGKLCRETGIIDTISGDIIFNQVCNGRKRLGWPEFLRACDLVSRERRCSMEAVLRAVIASGGPSHTHTTKAAVVRLHDDKSTYTGVYAQGGPTTVDPKMDLENMVDRQAAEYREKRASPLFTR